MGYEVVVKTFAMSIKLSSNIGKDFWHSFVYGLIVSSLRKEFYPF